MSGFCLECFNKIMDVHMNDKDVILSKRLNICDECRAMKHVIVRFRNKIAFEKFVSNMLREK